VRLQLKKDEEKEAANGKAPLHGMSATAFLTGGMQIEQAQYVSGFYGGRARNTNRVIDIVFSPNRRAWR
jgi:hypothetical protein